MDESYESKKTKQHRVLIKGGGTIMLPLRPAITKQKKDAWKSSASRKN